MPERVGGPLVCAKCGTTAPPEANGWKADIGEDPGEDDPPEVVMFCPNRARLRPQRLDVHLLSSSTHTPLTVVVPAKDDMCRFEDAIDAGC